MFQALCQIQQSPKFSKYYHYPHLTQCFMYQFGGEAGKDRMKLYFKKVDSRWKGMIVNLNADVF